VIGVLVIGFDRGENFFLFRWQGVELKTRIYMEVREARVGMNIVVVRASSGRPASSIFLDFPRPGRKASIELRLVKRPYSNILFPRPYNLLRTYRIQ